jgi:hypothetical protein
VSIVVLPFAPFAHIFHYRFAKDIMEDWKEKEKCRIDEQAEASLMSASSLVPEPRAEGGGRSGVTLARKDLHKAGGRGHN